MNHRPIGALSLCLIAALLLTGCLSEDQMLAPIAGIKEVTVPVLIVQSQNNVLAYVTSSVRLPAVPPSKDWQLERGEQSQGEYHFRSGDWRMTVWLPSSTDGNQHIVIFNSTIHIYWCGYIKPDGLVVDTAFLP